MDVVEVDVQVTTRDGYPIVDLKPEEFQLEVDGKPREALSIDLTRYGEPDRTATDPQVTVAERSATFATNKRQATGRLYLIALDLGNISRFNGKGATEAAARFVERLSPWDKVAVVSLPNGPSIDFTADHRRVMRIVERSVGYGAEAANGGASTQLSLAEAYAAVSKTRQDMWSAAQAGECSFSDPGRQDVCVGQLTIEAQMVVDELSRATRLSLVAFESVLKQLAKLSGQKFVVYIGEGMVTGRSLGVLDGLVDMRDIGRRAQEARASLYVLQYGNQFLNAVDASRSRISRTTFEDMRLREEGLEELAGAAGGKLFKLSTSADYAFTRIARETSANWIVRFATTERERDGKRHNIRVRVLRPGVDVQSRKQFVSTKSTKVAAAPSLSMLAGVMRSPMPANGIPMEVAAYALAEPGSQDMRLIVAGEIGCSSEPLSQADVMLGISDSKRRTIFLPVETATTLISRGGDQQCLYYETRLALPADDYTIRLAAMEPGGRTGSVDQAVAARFAGDGPVKASSLLLTDPGQLVAERMKIVVGDEFHHARVAAYIDLAASGTSTEAPGPVVLRLVDSGNQEQVVTQVPLETVKDPTREGGWYAEGTLDLPARANARYLLQAVVGDRQSPLTSSRPISTPPPALRRAPPSR